MDLSPEEATKKKLAAYEELKNGIDASLKPEPALEPATSKPSQEPNKIARPWWAGGELAIIIAAAAVAITFTLKSSGDPCVARKLSIGADNSIGIEEQPDPECRGTPPLEVRVLVGNSQAEPFADARVTIGKEVVASNDSGFATFQLDSAETGASLPVAVEVAGRKRKVASHELIAAEQGYTLTIQVADECRFAFVDGSGRRLTDIETPSLRFADTRPRLSSLDDGKGTWELDRCPSADDTLSISGTRGGRTCTRSIAATSLLEGGTLPWCEPCTLVLTEAGEPVGGVERVSMHFAEGPPIEAGAGEPGAWHFECDNQGFTGKFEPTKVTYARRGQVEVELASCNDDRWRRVCPLDTAPTEGTTDSAGTDSAGTGSGTGKPQPGGRGNPR